MSVSIQYTKENYATFLRTYIKMNKYLTKISSNCLHELQHTTTCAKKYQRWIEALEIFLALLAFPGVATRRRI